MLQLLAIAGAALLLLTCLAGAAATLRSQLAAARPAPLALAVLGLAFAAALWVRIGLLSPLHLMYVDEPWYVESARNLLARWELVLCEEQPTGTACRPYEKAVGWPVLLAGIFAFTGPTPSAAFAASALLGALCAPLAAIAARLGRGTWYHAALAGLLIAVQPLHAMWSMSAETNAASTLFLLAGLIGAVLFVRIADWAAALLAGGGLGFATAMRPELAAAAVPALVWIVAGRRGGLAQRLAIAGALLLGMLSIPLTWGLYVSNSRGAFLGLGNVAANAVLVATDAKGGHVTLAILLAAAVGVAATLRRRAYDVAALLGGAGALIATAVLTYDSRIFYARNLLGATVALVPLAALALPLRWPALGCGLAGTAAALLAWSSWAGVSTPTEAQQLENALTRQVAALSIPRDAIVLAEWPTIVRAATDLPTMATSRALPQLDAMVGERPVLLFCDMFCELGFSGSEMSACSEVLERYALVEVTAAELNLRRYGLYRLRPRRPGEVVERRCPRAAR